MKFLQKLGKALMLPVCVLPICGILMGIGYMLCPSAIQGGEIQGAVKLIGYLLVKAGTAAIDNMSVLFVIGVAIGMTDDNHGAAALAGIVSWLVITNLLSTKCMEVIYKGLQPDSPAYLAYSKIQNPTIGIIAGLIGAFCYNRFRSTRLPDFLAFFSGRRSVAIVTVLASFAASVVLAFIWPVCYTVLVAFGRWIASLGGIGSGIYAFLNRLLIPTGMHHALNNVFWFDTIGLGDLTKYWNGKTSAEVGWSLGMYMSGFFPCMIGGVPGAALAIYHCAKDKTKALGVLASTAFCALLCGLTEPFEFSFMFLCFPLYVVYSVLYGIFSVITYYTGFRAGFSFSAGVIDLFCSSSLPAAQKTLMIIPLSLAAFAAFYLAFRFMIRRFDLPTIGRGEDTSGEPSDHDDNILKDSAKADSPADDDGYLAKARGILKAVGGKGNVVNSDCCATRLRLELKDSGLVDEKLAKDFGALGVICPSPADCQIVIGLMVQQVLEAFKKALEEEPENNAGDLNTTGMAAGVTVPGAAAQGTAYRGTPIVHGQTIHIELKNKIKASIADHATEHIVSPVQVQEEPDGSFSFTYTLKDPAGIHARPAGRISSIVKKYGISADVEAEGKIASGASPVQLMGLGAGSGTVLKVRLSGAPEACAAAANELGIYLSESL